MLKAAHTRILIQVYYLLRYCNIYAVYIPQLMCDVKVRAYSLLYPHIIYVTFHFFFLQKIILYAPLSPRAYDYIYYCVIYVYIYNSSYTQNRHFFFFLI